MVLCELKLGNLHQAATRRPGLFHHHDSLPGLDAMASEESLKTKVYRLRGIPLHLDRQGVADLLCSCLPDISRNDISIASLAPSCGFWSSESKTATLTFSAPPSIVHTTTTEHTWRLPTPWLPEPLVLDDDFSGLTPLNDVDTEQFCQE